MTEQTETTITIYAVGHNMVGYLPEAKVFYTDDYDQAKRALIDDMERDADWQDEIGEHDVAEELSAAEQDLNLCSATDDNGGAWGEIVGNTSYWINVEQMSASEWEEYQDKF